MNFLRLLVMFYQIVFQKDLSNFSSTILGVIAFFFLVLYMKNVNFIEVLTMWEEDFPLFVTNYISSFNILCWGNFYIFFYWKSTILKMKLFLC